ncbi:hypothetical protein [Xanthomonas arboricola]|uniref:Uncharacterized protein n=1 Tax=Xanthomonas arboricola TaxID=56448 RepID=A0AB73H2A5_9XANT|nr:hypothetical protein [Xanthomonas arboricola]MBB5672472.1 hypothetical protein [Xanthomonas arboricola]
MRKLATIAVTVAMVTMFYNSSAYAMDAASKQAICDEIQKSAQDALTKNVQNYSPRIDPSDTFNSATQSCLDLIVQYNKIPMSWVRIEALQPILQELGRQLLTKSCKAAQAQFERTLKNALAENGLSYSGGQISYSTSSSNYGSGTVSVDSSGNVSTSGSGTAGGLLNLGN